MFRQTWNLRFTKNYFPVGRNRFAQKNGTPVSRETLGAGMKLWAEESASGENKTLNK